MDLWPVHVHVARTCVTGQVPFWSVDTCALLSMWRSSAHSAGGPEQQPSWPLDSQGGAWDQGGLEGTRAAQWQGSDMRWPFPLGACSCAFLLMCPPSSCPLRLAGQLAARAVGPEDCDWHKAVGGLDLSSWSSQPLEQNLTYSVYSDLFWNEGMPCGG